ncbi:MAG TPA: HEPN domain-containing protein [Polyangiaceae bacterium]|nr:HEPN domain-containing protein [Polyangiaceae bacterium]
MKTSLDHLPDEKREKLGAIAAMFREKVPLGLLVLFGSHARGDWVVDEDTGYQSDFDLLAVTHDPKQADDAAFWHELEARFREIAAPTPVTLIAHDVRFVNREIRIGQYFFGDIASEGVALYDARHFALVRPKALNARERLGLGEQNFAYWFASAGEFFRGCRYYAARDLLSHAAFLLHQAAERYFHAASLVLVGYKERSHDLEALGQKAAEQHPRLGEALPKAEPEDRHLFDLLKRAYIESRYSQSYRITAAELGALQARVLELARLVREVSLEKLASFCGPDAVSASLPEPPAPGEPLPAALPPPPADPADLARWARDVAELAELRGREAGLREGETRGREAGLREGEARGRAEGLREGEAKGKVEGLREGEAKGLREGEAKGLREGEAKGLRVAVLDLCELLGLEPTGQQRARLGAMGVGELEALRAAIKRAKRWPEGA